MKKEKWILWQDQAQTPETNMATDEALLLHINSIAHPLLRLYEWDRDALTIGYTQKYSEIPANRGDIIRRPTGGGVVFHKHHFTYTVAFPANYEICKTKPVESYRIINEAIIIALKHSNLTPTLSKDEITQNVKRSSMICFTNPTRYDILSGKQKIAGSAQRRTKQGLLHQGSIELENINQLSVKTIRASLPLAFKEYFKCFFEDFVPDEAFRSKVSELVCTKYSQDTWNKKR